MWNDALGWAATAVFTSSYFCKSVNGLRIVQACAAALWIGYGVSVKSAPVIVANVIVAVVAVFVSLRRTRERAGIVATEWLTGLRVSIME
ncbi:MAG: YgjV family protein [Terriglobales bacterium]